MVSTVLVWCLEKGTSIHSCSIAGSPVVVVNFLNYLKGLFYSPQRLTLLSVWYACTEMLIAETCILEHPKSGKVKVREIVSA